MSKPISDLRVVLGAQASCQTHPAKTFFWFLIPGPNFSSYFFGVPPLKQPKDRSLDHLIYEIRSRRVILDCDLAAIYGVPTKRLNEQFRRNRARFPDDFAFQLTIKEANALRLQIATSSRVASPLRSQIATSSTHGGRRYRPYAFTEHGALQVANILNNPDAVRLSVFVIRAFIKMREELATNASINPRKFATGDLFHTATSIT